MDVYTLPKVKEIASGKQRHSTGRSARCFAMTQRGGIGRVGGSLKREYGDVCVYMADSLCGTTEINTVL